VWKVCKILSGCIHVLPTSADFKEASDFIYAWGSEFLYEKLRRRHHGSPVTASTNNSTSTTTTTASSIGLGFGSDSKENKFSSLDSKEIKSELAGKIAIQLGQWLNKDGVFSLNFSINVDKPTDYWNMFTYTAPELASIALALLRINPTEASCERSFSHQKVIYRSLRNRLHRPKIHSEMMIKMNSSVLEKFKPPTSPLKFVS